MPTGEPNVARSVFSFSCVVFYGLLTFFLGVQCVVRRSKDGMDEEAVLLESKRVLYSVSE